MSTLNYFMLLIHFSHELSTVDAALFPALLVQRSQVSGILFEGIVKICVGIFILCGSLNYLTPQYGFNFRHDIVPESAGSSSRTVT